MSIANWFGFQSTDIASDELPEIFPLAMVQDEFVKIDVVNIYAKILTDVIERTHGLSEDVAQLLWDNCLKSESSDGLVTLLAKAMADKQDLFLVYEAAVKVLRLATEEERRVIEEDYKTKGESSVGVFISFKNYVRSDMVKLYSALEYCTVASLHKSMNLSKAVQLKINDLRGSTALIDSEKVKLQAKVIAKSLGRGQDILLDAKDVVETVMPDLTAIQASIQFLNQKRSFYLGMPESYINGEQTGGIGTTGEGDTKAAERGLKNYYESIIKPVLKVLFTAKTTYKSQDFRQIEGAMNILKTFELTSDELVSHDNKQLIVNRAFDLPEDAEGDEAPPADPVVINEGQKFATPPPPEQKAKGNA